MHRLVVTYFLFLVSVFGASEMFAGEFPDFASLPSRPELPDPLLMLDGTKITPSQRIDDMVLKRRM